MQCKGRSRDYRWVCVWDAEAGSGRARNDDLQSVRAVDSSWSFEAPRHRVLTIRFHTPIHARAHTHTRTPINTDTHTYTHTTQDLVHERQRLFAQGPRGQHEEAVAAVPQNAVAAKVGACLLACLAPAPHIVTDVGVKSLIISSFLVGKPPPFRASISL